jgi:hypothetical protein
VRDGVARFLLLIIALALVALVLLELGWLPRPAAARAADAPPAGRYQFSAARYGPLGNFLVRFDTATGKLERVRFPAGDVVWEEVGVVPAGKTATADPLQATPPPLPAGLMIGPGGLLQAAPAPTPAPGAPAPPGGGAGTP